MKKFLSTCRKRIHRIAALHVTVALIVVAVLAPQAGTAILLGIGTVSAYFLYIEAKGW